ncbi:dipeptide ABC transporter ATP-binding protein [Kribbella solani]|uniref:Peptide/nickel transport system ATP-binding protein n=1 Tax=Kribbella solani TaxID=236067 RepID=A0A841DZA9_9ACTN|nr:ABC transporter ATP-binding protein [Kribbella solani]MBB5980558.1 peptide/nickel transport system ATP-binding protein [Kribbella solani]
MTDPAVLHSPADGELANGTPLLSMHDLRITRGIKGPPLVTGLDLELLRGETVALVGESGAGKSLTARAAIKLVPPGLHVSGEVRFQGSDLVGMDEESARSLRGGGVAMLLQDPFTILNPLTRTRTHLIETLRSATGRSLSRTQAADEVARRLAEVGIDDPAVGDRYPFELSGGMRQRVALACALAKDPALLIADEPTTALDATTQREVLRLLRSVQQARGMGVLLITHDLRVAFSISDRVYVMYAGSVVEQARPTEFTDSPAHPYTVGLLSAEPPTDRRRKQLDGIPGQVPAVETVLDQCAFAARCAWATPDCEVGKPALLPVTDTHASACRRQDQIAHELRTALKETKAADAEPADDDLTGAEILRVSGLRKSYQRDRSSWALKGIDFTLREGRSLGIVGESGSGKTTLARCLLGLEEPTDGMIELLGTDITSYRGLGRKQLREIHGQIQCVFQDPYSSLNRSHTIGFILREALSRRAATAGPAPSAEELLERVGLGAHYATRRPVALSGGQRQRVAIARALAVAPKVLLCDEPVAALDVSVQGQVLQVLREVSEGGTQLLFITHDLAVVRQMTEDIVVLEQGTIVEAGTTNAVLDQPRHAYTQRLVGAVPTGDTGWLS